jgi:hypothetical protein
MEYEDDVEKKDQEIEVKEVANTIHEAEDVTVNMTTKA